MIADYGNGVQIWFMYGQFYVYGRTGNDPYVTSSEGHAREVAGSCL